MMGHMTAWQDLRRLIPELADRVQSRFEMDGHAILATLRPDGSPRLSGIEVSFVLGELWLGMMPNSWKALDLVRDPRCALHCITHGKDVVDGDAKLGANAVLEVDEDRVRAFAETIGALELLPMTLFRLDVQDMSILQPAGDHLLISSWRTGQPIRDQKRY